RAGVSTMTVSRALREGSRVSKATREKIMAAVNDLGYVLDQSAGTLSSRKTGFVAAMVPSLNNSNFADTARGITDELESTGLQLLLGYTDYTVEKEEKLIEAMLRRRPEGIIVTGGAHTERARRLLNNAGIPVVETWELPSKPIDQVVGFSNEEAMRLLVKTLARKGYRKFGYIGGTT
ncbi:MAG: LacI family DNA-binding transcriptional regulator, partial [Mesorhizobium sp.]